MDGNPNGNAATMRAALDAQRALALKQYRADLRALGGVLKQTLGRVDVDDAINERIETYAAQWPAVLAAVRPRRADMPYRILDRQRVEEGTEVAGRVHDGGARITKNKNQH